MARGFNSSGFGHPLTALCDICGHRRCDKRYSHVKCSKIRQQRPIKAPTPMKGASK